jgi:hypothetical protein
VVILSEAKDLHFFTQGNKAEMQIPRLRSE